MRGKTSNYETSGYRRRHNNYSRRNAAIRKSYNKRNTNKRNSYYRSSGNNFYYNTYPIVYRGNEETTVPYVRVKESRVTKRERKERSLHKMRLILSVMVIFAGCILMMCAYTAVHQQRIKNTKLKDDLIVLQNQNSTIAADMSADLSVDYIREEAVNRLGMVEPQDYQIVYINVDEQSYTVSYAENDTVEDEGFSLSGLLDFFKGE